MNYKLNKNKKTLIILGLLIYTFFAKNTYTENIPIHEAFVTFATKNYFPLLEVTIKSVHAFSTRPIIAYGINDDIPFDTQTYPNLIKRRINSETMGSWPLIYFQKFNIILQSNINYGVYIESDDIANHNIDELFNLCHTIKEYPLCPIHPHDPNDYGNVMKTLDVTQKTNPYVHGHIIFAESCKPFLQECFTASLRLGKDTKANWDETILNVMLWKYGVSNWHTHLYDPYFKIVDDYLARHSKEKYYMFHGCKDVYEAHNILTKLINRYKITEVKVH